MTMLMCIRILKKDPENIYQSVCTRCEDTVSFAIWKKEVPSHKDT